MLTEKQKLHLAHAWAVAKIRENVCGGENDWNFFSAEAFEPDGRKWKKAVADAVRAGYLMEAGARFKVTSLAADEMYAALATGALVDMSNTEMGPAEGNPGIYLLDSTGSIPSRQCVENHVRVAMRPDDYVITAKQSRYGYGRDIPASRDTFGDSSCSHYYATKSWFAERARRIAAEERRKLLVQNLPAYACIGVSAKMQGVAGREAFSTVPSLGSDPKRWDDDVVKCLDTIGGLTAKLEQARIDLIKLRAIIQERGGIDGFLAAFNKTLDDLTALDKQK